jgi:hypothetical protein
MRADYSPWKQPLCVDAEERVHTQRFGKRQPFSRLKQRIIPYQRVIPYQLAIKLLSLRKPSGNRKPYLGMAGFRRSIGDSSTRSLTTAPLATLKGQKVDGLVRRIAVVGAATRILHRNMCAAWLQGAATEHEVLRSAYKEECGGIVIHVDVLSCEWLYAGS